MFLSRKSAAFAVEGFPIPLPISSNAQLCAALPYSAAVPLPPGPASTDYRTALRVAAFQSAACAGTIPYWARTKSMYMIMWSHPVRALRLCCLSVAHNKGFQLLGKVHTSVID